MQQRHLKNQTNEEKELQASTILDTAMKSINVAIVATWAFIPLSLITHHAHTKIEKQGFSRPLLSSQSIAQISAGSIYTGIQRFFGLYTNNIKASTTKIALKNSSEEIASENDETKTLKNKNIASDFFPLGLSFAFGILETIVTQSFAVKSTHIKQEIQLRAQGLTYSKPIRSPGIKGWISRTKEGFTTRALKNGTILVAYPTTELYRKCYEQSGWEDYQAKWMAIAMTGATLGVVINAFDIVFTNQILLRSSAIATIYSIVAKNGVKGLLAGAGISIINTGFANWLIPEVEKIVDNILLPPEKKVLQALIKANADLAKSNNKQNEVFYELAQQGVKQMKTFGLFKPLTKVQQAEILQELDFCAFSLG